MRFISARVHQAPRDLYIELGTSLEELVVYVGKAHDRLFFDMMSPAIRRAWGMQERGRTRHAFALYHHDDALRLRIETLRA
jgi:hypothetical protein